MADEKQIGGLQRVPFHELKYQIEPIDLIRECIIKAIELMRNSDEAGEFELSIPEFEPISVPNDVDTLAECNTILDTTDKFSEMRQEIKKYYKTASLMRYAYRVAVVQDIPHNFGKLQEKINDDPKKAIDILSRLRQHCEAIISGKGSSMTFEEWQTQVEHLSDSIANDLPWQF